MCRAPPASECCCEWLKSYEHCYLPLACVRPTVLSSADRVPPRAGRADARTHEAQAAEAAGQRTARGRLLRRVGPPVQLPPVQKIANGANGNAPPLGGGRLQETLSAAVATARAGQLFAAADQI